MSTVVTTHDPNEHFTKRAFFKIENLFPYIVPVLNLYLK